MSKPKDAATSAPQEILPPVPTGKGKAAKAAKVEKGEGDVELEGLMAETESDLRQEELQKIWQRYGKLIIAVGVVLIAVAGGVQLWRQHVAERRADLADRYDQAQRDLSEGKTDDAQALFATIAKTGSEGYGTLAELQRAALLIQKKDTNGAVAIYKTIAADSHADRVFRDLATILQVLHTIDQADPKTLDPLLAPLTDGANPFHSSALELSALVAGKEGDNARAAKIADQLLTDPTTPQNMRTRVEDLAAYYKAQEAAKAPAAPSKP